MVVRSKRKGRFVIGNTSPDAKPQDKSIENVCYYRIHVQNDVSYERVLVPDDHVVYDIIPGEVDSGKRTHPPPTNQIVINSRSTTSLYRNLPSPLLTSPPPLPTSPPLLVSPTLPPLAVSSPLSNTSLHFPPLPSTPLQTDPPPPPPNDPTLLISVATFHEHVHHMHMNGDRGFELEYHQVWGGVSLGLWLCSCSLCLQLCDVIPEVSSVAALECNTRKNRFGNILPCQLLEISSPHRLINHFPSKVMTTE